MKWSVFAEDDISVLIEKEGGRLCENIKLPFECLFRIEQCPEGIPAIRPVFLCRLLIFLQIDANECDFWIFFVHLLKKRQFFFTERTPRCPEINNGGFVSTMLFKSRLCAIQKSDIRLCISS